MNTPPSAFDESIDRWILENNLPWMKLKTEIGLSNLKRHMPGKGLRILDAGGGSGSDAIPLAREGHRVDLVDYSAEMLRVAREDARREGVEKNIRIRLADVSQLERIFPQLEFEAVLCHNVLQFLSEVRSLLSSLAAALVPGGILSLMSGNRYSLPYQKAFLGRDLDEALRQIDSRTYQNPIFHSTVTLYSADEIREMLPAAGLSFQAHYGIRCLSDYWGDNDTKSKPDVWAGLERLEYALTDRYPYKLLARFWQIIARKA